MTFVAAFLGALCGGLFVSTVGDFVRHQQRHHQIRKHVKLIGGQAWCGKCDRVFGQIKFASEPPWPLCTHPSGCLAAADREGGRCPKHPPV